MQKLEVGDLPRDGGGSLLKTTHPTHYSIKIMWPATEGQQKKLEQSEKGAEIKATHEGREFSGMSDLLCACGAYSHLLTRPEPK